MASKYDDDDSDSECKHEGKFSERSEGKDTHHRLTPKELISKVQQYFFEDEALASTFEQFVRENAHIVDLSSSDNEAMYKLEYTEVYNKYKQLFEEKMENFIVDTLHSSIQEFFSAIKSKTDEDSTSHEAIFGQILLAVTDFDIFMTMMREVAQNQRRK